MINISNLTIDHRLVLKDHKVIHEIGCEGEWCDPEVELRLIKREMARLTKIPSDVLIRPGRPRHAKRKQIAKRNSA